MPPVWKEQFFDIPKEKRENNKRANSSQKKAISDEIETN